MTWRKKEIAEKIEKDNEPETKPLEVVFMPGCFDSFEGTQEELEEIMAMIQAKVADGSILTEARQLDLDDEDDLEFLEEIALKMEAQNGRTLQ